jgi:hypothetical protein
MLSTVHGGQGIPASVKEQDTPISAQFAHFRTVWKKIRNNKDKRRNKTYSRVVLNEATNAGVVNGQRSVRDCRELAVAMRIMSNEKGFVRRWNGGQDKAFGSQTSRTRRRWRWCRREWLKND